MKETPEEIAQLEYNLKHEVDWKPVKSPIKMWKDKDGKKVGFKEFMSRWKKGIQQVTPLQQTKVQMRSTYIMIVGLLSGLVFTLMDFKRLWWLGLILVAGLFNTGVSAIGIYQKKVALQKIEDITREVEDD